MEAFLIIPLAPLRFQYSLAQIGVVQSKHIHEKDEKLKRWKGKKP